MSSKQNILNLIGHMEQSRQNDSSFLNSNKWKKIQEIRVNVRLSQSDYMMLENLINLFCVCLVHTTVGIGRSEWWRERNTKSIELVQEYLNTRVTENTQLFQLLRNNNWTYQLPQAGNPSGKLRVRDIRSYVEWWRFANTDVAIIMGGRAHLGVSFKSTTLRNLAENDISSN